MSYTEASMLILLFLFWTNSTSKAHLKILLTSKLINPARLAHIIPVIVKALQELSTKVDNLTNRVTALE